jgi:hypothetical protein
MDNQKANHKLIELHKQITALFTPDKVELMQKIMLGKPLYK